MTIRTRLAVQFVVLASLTLGVAFVVVYLRAADFRQEEFLGRLHDRGVNAAKLLIQVAEVDDKLLRIMEGNSPVRLPDEEITIFDKNNAELLHLGTTGRHMTNSRRPCWSANATSAGGFTTITRTRTIRRPLSFMELLEGQGGTLLSPCPRMRPLAPSHVDLDADARVQPTRSRPR